MDIAAVRDAFPVTRARVRAPDGQEHPLVYLDHAASTHAPTPVLEVVQRFMSETYANVHRGAHQLSERSTDAFEDARETVRRFLKVPDDRDIVFTHNTTSALNLAAHLAEHDAKRLGRAGATITSSLEHHSNLLPHRARGPVECVGMTTEGRLDLPDLERRLAKNSETRLVAITAASNVTGFRTPVGDVLGLAARHDAPVLIDGAQILAHGGLDFSALPNGGPSYFAAAGHKAYAPFGCGFLVAPRAALEASPPFLPGGGTVRLVTDTETYWTEGVERHEGGTPPVIGAVALAEALRFIERAGRAESEGREHALLARLLKGMSGLEGVQVLGSTSDQDRVGAISFMVDNLPPPVVAKRLNDVAGVAVRHGCFCAHPYLLRLLKVPDDDPRLVHLRHHPAGDEDPGAVRASLGIYTNEADVNTFTNALGAIVAAR